MRDSVDLLISRLQDNNNEALYKCRYDSVLCNSTVSDICEALRRRLDFTQAHSCLTALFRIGAPASTALGNVFPYLKDKNEIIRRVAVQTVGSIGHRNPEAIVPAITKMLDYDDCLEDSLRILGSMGEHASASLATIVSHFHSTKAKARGLVVKTAFKIDPNSSIVIDLINSAVSDKSKAVSNLALSLLSNGNP